MRSGIILGSVGAALLLGLTGGLASAAPTCTATNFFVDGKNMTAAEINPGSVTGTVDATGCNIGIYYDANGEVNAADVFGANYFGVLVNGTGGSVSVNVTNSSVHDIGEVPQDGTQHGNAIFYINGGTGTTDDSRTCGGGSAIGTVSANMITAYQKNGIVVKCPGTSVAVKGNTVDGGGPVASIARNGIEVGLGGGASVTHNSVTGNSYTGGAGASSCGVLVFGGQCFSFAGETEIATVNTSVARNSLTGNDVGIDSVNTDDCSAPVLATTNNNIAKNHLSNGTINNTTGCSTTETITSACGTVTKNSTIHGYQAGVQDFGAGDQISGNLISGCGYLDGNKGAGDCLWAVDITGSGSPKLIKNHISP